MMIPTNFKVGRKSYYVKQDITLPYKINGRIHPNKRLILIKPLNPKMDTVFWHEVTHAILHDMDAHVKWTNEDFVKKFSDRLAQVVRTARFDG